MKPTYEDKPGEEVRKGGVVLRKTLGIPAKTRLERIEEGLRKLEEEIEETLVSPVEEVELVEPVEAVIPEKKPVEFRPPSDDSGEKGPVLADPPRFPPTPKVKLLTLPDRDSLPGVASQPTEMASAPVDLGSGPGPGPGPGPGSGEPSLPQVKERMLVRYFQYRRRSGANRRRWQTKAYVNK